MGGGLSIQHKGTKDMWADVNTKPVQGLLFRKFRHEMMGVPVEYDDDVERRNTHPMLLPKTKKASKRVIPRGSDGKSISPRTKATAKRRSVLGEEKYGPGSEPQWKAGGARYPNLYKALLEEPSRTLRTKLLEDIPSGKTGDGRNTRRPARARIRNQ